LELKLGDVAIAESPSGGFPPSGSVKPPFSHRSIGTSVVSC
jgi:hypothetical protein